MPDWASPGVLGLEIETGMLSAWTKTLLLPSAICIPTSVTRNSRKLKLIWNATSHLCCAFLSALNPKWIHRSTHWHRARVRYPVSCRGRSLQPKHHPPPCKDISDTYVFPRSNKEQKAFRSRSSATRFPVMPSAINLPSGFGLRKWRPLPSEAGLYSIRR